jgi:hypothetical protein
MTVVGFILQLEEMYKKGHAAIRANPEAKAKPTKEVKVKR